MSWQTILQPDGKLSIYSTVIDDFIKQDMTVDEVLMEYEKADKQACEMNLEYCWAKLSDERKDEEAKKFMLEASQGFLEQVEGVQSGVAREGDWSWGEAVQIIGRCHGKRRMLQVVR